MRRIILTIVVLLSITCGVALSEDGKLTKSLQLQLKQNEEKVQQLESKNYEIKNDLINRTIGIYQITNDRLNSHISYLSLIATIFGLIIAIGGAWIGYESIRSRKRTEEAISTLEEAKKYVESKKEEFDERIGSRLKDIDVEFQKVVELLKEQLVSDINKTTEEVKNLAEIKTQEIHGYSIEERSEEALESINRRITFFDNIGIPDDPKILLSKAKLLDEKEMYNEAIELLEKLVKLDPKNSNGFWQLGWEFSKMKEYEKSIENYNKCIQLNPNYAAAYNNMGVALQRLERLDESLESYEMAISKANDKLYYSNKAKVLQKLEKFDDSIETYKKAISLFPIEEELYKEMLDILLKTERYDEMVEYCDVAINNIEEKNQVYNFTKATVLAKLDKADEAIHILTNLAEQNYKTSECYIEIANIKVRLGKQEDATTILDKAISMDPKNGDLYLKKASLLIDDNNNKAYETVISGSEHVKEEGYLQRCGRLFASKGDVINARELYKKAGDISKAKFLEKKSEGDLMNYYESLLITKEYDESDKLLKEFKSNIISDKYHFVLKVLKLYEIIMKNMSIDIEKEAGYYLDVTIKDKNNWFFDDILNFLRLEAPEKSYNFASSVIQLLNKEINKDDFKKIVDSCT